MALFAVYGEFDSFGEINELAENLFNDNKLDGLRTLGRENGIPEDFVEMYISGDIPVLCDAMTAAIGKLDVEAAELKVVGLMCDWIEYIKAQVQENNVLAYKVRQKGKSLKGCIAALLRYSYGNQWNVPKEIIKEAGATTGRVTFGVPDMSTAKKVINHYYMG